METKENEAPKMEVPKPQKEHQWLQRMVGEWTSQPDQNTMPGHHSWIESVRSIGGLWVVSEGRGLVPDIGESWTIMTLGFNPHTNRFVGSFIGSMMTHFWQYDGELDTSRDALVLYADGPDMSSLDGKLAKYRDTLQFIDKDQRLLKSEMQKEDGTWTEFMTVHYDRKK
jgi:hypothetical protein